MNLYTIEVTIHAAAYVKARTPNEAMSFELPGNGDFPEPFPDARFDDPGLPLASISPALTIGALAPSVEPASAKKVA